MWDRERRGLYEKESPFDEKEIWSEVDHGAPQVGWCVCVGLTTLFLPVSAGRFTITTEHATLPSNLPVPHLTLLTFYNTAERTSYIPHVNIFATKHFCNFAKHARHWVSKVWPHFCNYDGRVRNRDAKLVVTNMVTMNLVLWCTYCILILKILCTVVWQLAKRKNDKEERQRAGLQLDWFCSGTEKVTWEIWNGREKLISPWRRSGQDQERLSGTIIQSMSHINFSIVAKEALNSEVANIKKILLSSNISLERYL